MFLIAWAGELTSLTFGWLWNCEMIAGCLARVVEHTSVRGRCRRGTEHEADDTGDVSRFASAKSYAWLRKRHDLTYGICTQLLMDGLALGRVRSGVDPDDHAHAVLPLDGRRSRPPGGATARILRVRA